MKRPVCINCLISLGILMLVSLSPLIAADRTIDEDELFTGETTVEEANKVVAEDVDRELRDRRLGISGECRAQSTFTNYAPTPDWLGNQDEDGFQNLLSTDLFLDFRFQKGVKSFLSVGTDFYPDEYSARSAGVSGAGEADRVDCTVNEFFADANWKNKVYCRVGKQVLKWGPGYFWNPTDLINIAKKDFFKLDGSREGTTGIKVHLPTGVKRNIYFFAGLEDAGSLTDIPMAGKYEWLAGKSEMSLSVWSKGHRQPVFGYDISTWIGKVNCWGELSLAAGRDTRKFDAELRLLPSEGWYTKVSIGLNRKFNYGEYQDRISLTGEFFYNQAGYADNLYQKIAAQNDADRRQKLRDAYLNEYQAYQNSQYYLAVFGTVTKFLIPELTLKVNGINNLVDHSLILSAGISYQPTLKELYYNFEINSFQGDSDSEARFLGKTHQLQLGVAVKF